MKKIHPHQKPVALYRWLIKVYGGRARTVFDPFAGSASCGVACQQMGRSYVGCEVCREFYDAAYARLFDTPLPMPDPEYLPLMPGTRVD